MNKYGEILTGLILVVVSVYAALPEAWGGPYGGAIWPSVKTFLIGGITVGVFLLGALFLMIGIMDMRV